MRSLARATAATAVLTNAGTALAITATPDPVRPGELVQYAITVTNRTASSQFYSITAPVPNHTTVASNAVSSGGGCGLSSCPAGTIVTWGSHYIAAGQSDTVQFAALVDTASPPPNGTLISTTAAATANGNGASAAKGVVAQGSPVCTTAGTVSGSVIDATTGQPLAGVQLSIDASATTSAANGSFSFPSLAGGLHLLISTASGFAGGGVAVNVCGNITLNVLLTHNQTTFGLRSLSAYAADPVNTATGNYAFARTDLKLPGKGLGFVFERNYNSLDPQNGPLGFGWSHSYNASLSVDGSGNVTTRHGDGHTATFAPKIGGGYRPQYGVFDTLVQEADASYTLTTKELTAYRFGSNLKLLSMADRNGNTVALTYASGLLTRITDTAGRHLDFTYDGAGRITTLTDPLGRTVQFTYDGAGNLVTSTDPAGKVTRYTYDGNHQLLTATDPRGNVFVTNTYDASLRVVTTQHDAKGGQTTYAYDSVSRQTTVTDALGQVTHYTHDSLLRLIRDDDALGHSRYFSYDAAGNRTAVTDRNGNTTTYAYDSTGNVTQKTDPLGKTTTITYDAHNNPLTRTDALGLVTTFAYDAKGNLTGTTDALGHTLSATYDSAGLPLTLTDARGNVTTNNYDLQGNLTQVHDALGNVTTFTYDAVGRQLTKSDALGRVTSYAYDADDNLIALTDALGHATVYGYDGNNNRVSVTNRRGLRQHHRLRPEGSAHHPHRRFGWGQRQYL